MKILSIETSCDETAVSILYCKGSVEKPNFKVLGNALYSQVKIHAQYGGVFPNLAKREHQKNLVPLLKKTLIESRLLKPSTKNKQSITKIQKILEREPELLNQFMEFIPKISKPKIDAIAVTYGPGLEPALWVGINFAKALGTFWGIPVVPVNHMEGHIVSVLLQEKSKINLPFPVLALLISGGHTELVYAKKPLSYEVIGKTRDDALGEAYDKVARMLSLPYPGGPEISKLAEKKRNGKKTEPSWNLPRPMIHTKDYDFSFSGLKTSVLYKIKNKKISLKEKTEIAFEFENAVTEVIISKTKKAIEKYKPRSLIIGGGVIANNYIRKEFENLINKFPNTKLFIPLRELATDNSTMIGMTGYLRIKRFPNILRSKKLVRAEGNLKL